MSDTKRFITAEDLLKLRFPSDPQISPDGSKVVFVVKVINEEKNKYFSHLWLVSTDVGEPKQFTQGEVSDRSPRWSPDGKWIAFIRTRDKQTQIYVIPADGGEARQVTTLEQGGISQIEWSPDGTRLAFVYSKTPEEWTEKAAEERKKNNRSTPPRIITKLRYKMDGVGFLGERPHVWVVDVEDGEARQITDGDYDDGSPCWSPDGKTIAFVSNRSADPDETPYEVDIWLVSAEGGEMQKVPTPTGYKGGLAWSPDGKLIAYGGVETKEDPWVPKNNHIWVVSPEGGDARCLTTALTRTVGNSTLSDTRDASFGGAALWAGNDKLVFQVSDEGSCRLYTVGLDGSAPKPMFTYKVDVSGFSVDASGENVAVMMGGAVQLPDVFVFQNGERKRLTHLHRVFLDEVQLSTPEEIWFNSADGTKVQGWILKPPNFDAKQKYPLIFYIHGGPHTQYGNAFFHEFQLHAARGYVVFYTNPRGSMGYDESFAAAIRGDWGNKDYEDMIAAADYAAKLPYVDATRMAVAGGSYGGYSTNWIVSHTDRFKCAVTDRSVVNLVSMAGTCDFVFEDHGYWKANWWDDTADFVQQSPLTYVANVKTPLLIIHSEGDLRCPISQAEELYSALKRLKKEVVFVRYPAETSHGLSRSGPPDLRLHRLEQICNWFDKYLK